MKPYPEKLKYNILMHSAHYFDVKKKKQTFNDSHNISNSQYVLAKRSEI